MKKIIARRFLSALLVVVMTISSVPIASVPVTAAGKTLAQLRATFPDGSYWNHYVNKAEESSNYYRDKGISNAHSDSVSNTACWSHEASGYDSYKGHYDCNRFGGATQCKGFAYKLGYCAYETMPTSWGKGTKSTLKAGDVLVYSDSSTDPTWGHTVFIIGRSGSTVSVAECNWGGKCKIKWDRLINLDSITIKEIFSAPYALTGGNPTTHTVDSSYSTNISAYPKAKITAANIFDANHTQISSTAWIGTSDLCTIHEVYTDGCCKVTYPLDNGETKTVYSKISLFRASVPSVKYWVSSTEYGNEVSEGIAGNSYYLCYYLYDKISKKDWDEVVSSDYEIRLTIYNPDGSVKYTNENKFDYDRSWIRSFFGEAGTYKVELSAVSGYSGSSSKSFVVKENPIKVNSSTNSVSLKLGETESKTIYIGYSGYYDGNWELNYQRSNSNVSCTWGDWTDDHRSPLTIKANAMGETTVTISVKDKDTGAVLDSTTVTVSVGAKSYTVSFNANGGSGAPGSQTKYHNTTLTLSTTKPTRTGYTFLGWSTSSTATSATYQSGGKFTINADTTLYAVWKNGCENGAHNYTYKVSKNPTTSATGTLKGSCSKCSATKTVTLPKLNTTDYTYKVTKSATCTASGTSRYTWRDTTYGSFYFDVTLSAVGHNYEETVTKPTCTAEGYTTHTCPACGDSYKDSETAATGHSYTYKVTKSPSKSANGTLTGMCSNCDGTIKVTIPQLNRTEYTYKVVTAATCDEIGTERYIWKNTTYGSFYFDVTIPSVGHSYSETVTKPTCTEEGYTTHTCSACGDSYTDSETEATGHSYTYQVKKAPTAVLDGELEGKCERCSLVKTVTLPKLNTENYVYQVILEAGCENTGTVSYTWRDTTYGTFSFVVELTAKGHRYENDCDADCSVCGLVRTPADHVYDDDHDVICNECGYERTLYTSGDLDETAGVTSADAIYLLYHALFGDGRYPVNQPVDYNKDGAVSSADAIYLLYHSLFGATRYPL